MSIQAIHDLTHARHEMVRLQLAARGIRDPRVLEAFRTVPREAFVPEHLAEFAYEDSPLPIGEGQTISQPYIVALMVEALELKPGDRVLEVGTGSGYAAAILARVASEVYTIERIQDLAEAARARCRSLGLSNVHVIHGDGSLGWLEQAPYDAIVVAAGGPEAPRALLAQLRVGGRLVIPVGPSLRLQRLVCIRRTGDDAFEEEELTEVRFVPLVGAQGWGKQAGTSPSRPRGEETRTGAISTLVRESAEAIPSIEGAQIGPLLDRVGDARIVLLSEATHGTSDTGRKPSS